MPKTLTMHLMDEIMTELRTSVGQLTETRALARDGGEKNPKLETLGAVTFCFECHSSINHLIDLQEKLARHLRIVMREDIEKAAKAGK